MVTLHKTFLRSLTLTLVFSLGSPLIGSAAPQNIDAARKAMRRETQITIDALQGYHYKKTPFIKIESKVLLNRYLDALDNRRMFFLQDDVDFTLMRFEKNLKTAYLFSGDLYPAFEIYDLYEKRVQDRLDWIAERLKKDFDLNTDLTFQVDRKEEPWPADAAQADSLWEKRLTNDLIVEMLGDQSIEEAKAKVAKRYDRWHKTLENFEPQNIQETFLTTLAEIYDPHSSFFSWDTAQDFEIDISNSLIGIGAQLRDVDGYCVVERILPGGPAEQSGKIHPGDKIVAVAQGESEAIDVVGMKLRRIVQMIRGTEGTEVRLTIQPLGAEKQKIIHLVRNKIELAANLASAQIIEVPDDSGTHSIGVIELPSFYGDGHLDGEGTSTSQDVKELLIKLSEFNIEGLVVDLRRNGGGLLSEAVALTGLFIEDGPVVMKRNFDGSVDEDWDNNPSVTYTGPLVVLTSRMSASASEIMAGALQSYKRAIIVGDESTYGKGTVQSLLELNRMAPSKAGVKPQNWGMLKLTIQKFYLPDGASTQKRGVLSDILIPSLRTDLLVTEAEQDFALDWDSLTPHNFGIIEGKHQVPTALVSDSLLSELKKRSESRIESLPEFNFFKRELTWRTDLIERDEFSLNLDARRTSKEERELTSDAFDDERETLTEELAYKHKKVELALAEIQDKEHQAKLRESLLPNGKARMNQFYQKVYYYEKEADQEIVEIWVEYLDYEKAMDHTTELTKTFSQSAEIEMTEDEMGTILKDMKNADRGGEFQVESFFKQTLGNRITDAALEKALPSFFRQIVDWDDKILDDRPTLDVQLRESMRIVDDWIKLAANPKIQDASAIATIAEKPEAQIDTHKTKEN